MECADSSISGTIESLVFAELHATTPKTTGTINGNAANWGNVTFDGKINYCKGHLSWEPNASDNTKTDITMSGSSHTITIDNATGNKVS